MSYFSKILSEISSNIFLFYTDTGKMNWIDQAKVTDQDWRGRFSLTAIFCEWISTGLNYIL